MTKNTGLSDEFQKIDDKIKRKKWHLFCRILFGIQIWVICNISVKLIKNFGLIFRFLSIYSKYEWVVSSTYKKGAMTLVLFSKFF